MKLAWVGLQEAASLNGMVIDEMEKMVIYESKEASISEFYTCVLLTAHFAEVTYFSSV